MLGVYRQRPTDRQTVLYVCNLNRMVNRWVEFTDEEASCAFFSTTDSGLVYFSLAFSLPLSVSSVFVLKLVRLPSSCRLFELGGIKSTTNN